MHVLMLSDVYFPRINGVSTSIETFRNDLAEQNIDITLIAPHYPQPQESTSVWRVPSRKVPFDPEDRLMHWRPLLGKLREAGRRDIDLVHIQTPFIAHYAGLRAKRLFGIPAIATYHTHFEEYIHHYLPIMPRPLLRSIARGIARSQCNDLDAVVVPSLAMRDTLSDYGVTAPLHILPTGIPISQFANGNGAAFRLQYGIPVAAPMALFVGRVAHEKNIGFLLEACKRALSQLPDFRLMIAGEGPALPALKRMVVTLGIEKNVIFVGYLDRAQDLPDCYAAADVFVFASKTETQGLVLLEAMAAGIPVYAFAAMGTCDIVGPQQGAIAAPDDVSAFAEGLARLLSNPEQRIQMSQEAKKFALSWSAPERAEQLATLYRSLTD
jgi:glycosyltransferase involved in cell wall biosynthesis